MDEKWPTICFWFIILTSGVLVQAYSWGSYFRHLRPMRCGEHYHHNHECSSIVTKEQNCSIPIETGGWCDANTTYENYEYLTLFTQLTGRCFRIKYLPCSVSECKSSCCEGYYRNKEGQCVEKLTCFNGGTSIANGSACACPVGYTGIQCDQGVCDPPCENGGVCSFPPNSQCYCPPYLQGKTCTIPKCDRKCSPHEVCILNGTASFCTCASSHGSRCQDIDSRIPSCTFNANIPQRPFGCHRDNDCNEGEYCCRTHNYPFGGKCAPYPGNFTCSLPGEQGEVISGGTEHHNFSTCQTCVCDEKLHGAICYSRGCTGPFVNTSTCCEDDNGVCYAPVIHYCPHGNIVLYVNKDNRAYLTSNRKFTSTDCLGVPLEVKVSQKVFSVDPLRYPSESPVSVQSQPDFNGRVAKCDFKVITLDSVPPYFTNCPPNVYAWTNEKIIWSKPVAEDNVKLMSLNYMPSILQNNSYFSAGTYIIIYQATDIAGNSRTCRFTVYVYDGDKADSTESPGLNARKTHISGIVIAGLIVGVLSLTLLMVSVAACKFCRKNRALNQRSNCRSHLSARCRRRLSTDAQHSSVFSVFSSEPPPYDVALTLSTPPLYKDKEEEPPAYGSLSFDNTGYVIIDGNYNTDDGHMRHSNQNNNDDNTTNYGVDNENRSNTSEFSA